MRLHLISPFIVLAALLALLAAGCGGDMLEGEEDSLEEGSDEGALSPEFDTGREPLSCNLKFAHPAPGSPVTSKFGPRSSGYHYGVDFGIRYGNVHAAEAGVVVVTGWDPGGYGRWIEVKHCGGYRTRYGHLNAFKHKVGNTTTRGEVIAQSGNTGHSTGPHLHFEIRLNGTAKNPCGFFHC